MTAQEFGECRIWMQEEGMLPQHTTLRHAQLLASLHNGPMTRKSGHFRTIEFIPETWQRPEPVVEKTVQQVFADVERLNALMG